MKCPPLPALPEKVTYYGRPTDPFVRIVERYRWEPVGDGTNSVNLVVDRQVFARACLEKVVVDVRFTGSEGKAT